MRMDPKHGADHSLCMINFSYAVATPLLNHSLDNSLDFATLSIRRMLSCTGCFDQIKVGLKVKLASIILLRVVTSFLLLISITPWIHSLFIVEFVYIWVPNLVIRTVDMKMATENCFSIAWPSSIKPCAYALSLYSLNQCPKNMVVFQGFGPFKIPISLEFLGPHDTRIRNSKKTIINSWIYIFLILL